MYLLQNNNWQASTLFRGLLAIIFMFWLATVLLQYDEKSIAKKLKITTTQLPSNIVIEQLALPPIPKPIPIPKEKPQTAPVNKQMIEQVYQKLSDDAVDIQIAWPRHANTREATLEFMYQCVGVQFAVLSGNTFTKINHTKINHTKLNQSTSSDYSDWVRVAQGSLSKKEHNWLNAYALNGTPIRLFPRSIDWRLAQYLTSVLKGAPLTSFRANYQVTNRQLQLTHIHINKQQITDNWLLYKSMC